MPKRNDPGIASSQPPSKRQVTLPTSSVSQVAILPLASVPVDAAISAERSPPSCRLVQDGYIEVLRKKHFEDERYASFFEENSVNDISNRLGNYFTAALLKVLNGRNETDVTALLAIGGDIHFNGAGWYLHIITDETDPTWYALYVGQSEMVGKRIRYHKTHFTIADSLHYFTWRHPGKKSVFVLLGCLPVGLEDEAIILNIGEQLLATVFQALPEVMMPEYLPSGVKVRLPHHGLMVARPMKQGHRDAVNDAWMIYKSSDPLARQFANTVYKASLDEGRRTQVALEQAPQIATKRAKSKKAHLFRDPDEDYGDSPSVMR